MFVELHSIGLVDQEVGSLGSVGSHHGGFMGAVVRITHCFHFNRFQFASIWYSHIYMITKFQRYEYTVSCSDTEIY